MVLVGDVDEPGFFHPSETTSACGMSEDRVALVKPAATFRKNALRTFVIDAAGLFPSKHQD